MIIQLIQLILAATILWSLFAIVLPVFILPNFYFRTSRKQRTKYIIAIVKKLKDKSKKKTLRNVYQHITKNYIGMNERYKLFNYPKLFQSNVNYNLKHKNQFLACHLQNWLMMDILLNTGQFKRRDIKRRLYVTHFLVTHQYLIIKIGKKRFAIDPFYRTFRKLKSR